MTEPSLPAVLPSRDEPGRVWGMVYSGRGDPDVARQAVEDALAGANMDFRTDRLGPELFQVRGEQTEAWYHVLLCASAADAVAH